MTHIEFTVEGKGQFPLDMLRHDRCYPVDPQDAEMIGLSLDTEGYIKPKKFKVRLGSERNARADMTPTEGRWESFLWKVVEVHRD